VKLGAVLLFVGGLAVLAPACGGKETPCYAGDWQRCDCATGGSGYQQCSADGEAYGACDCSGNIPGVPSLDGSVDAPAESAPDAGLLPFMSPCEKNEECVTGNCFPFNSKGPHCTKPCTQATDCPPPSTGCSNMGVCKSP
jgi:hypothetical protein